MALRAGNSKQYNGYVVSWQMPAEVFAPISYRETSSFARARRSMNEWITGTMKIATIPPANPLLYKFTPPCIIPTFVAKRKCNIPAINPIL